MLETAGPFYQFASPRRASDNADLDALKTFWSSSADSLGNRTNARTAIIGDSGAGFNPFEGCVRAATGS